MLKPGFLRFLSCPTVPFPSAWDSGTLWRFHNRPSAFSRFWMRFALDLLMPSSSAISRADDPASDSSAIKARLNHVDLPTSWRDLQAEALHIRIPNESVTVAR